MISVFREVILINLPVGEEISTDSDWCVFLREKLMVNYDHIHGFKTQQVCIQPKCTWPDKAALLHDVQSVLSHITSGSDSATLSKIILLQKCRSSTSYGKKIKKSKRN